MDDKCLDRSDLLLQTASSKSTCNIIPPLHVITSDSLQRTDCGHCIARIALPLPNSARGGNESANQCPTIATDGVLDQWRSGAAHLPQGETAGRTVTPGGTAAVGAPSGTLADIRRQRRAQDVRRAGQGGDRYRGGVGEGTVIGTFSRNDRKCP